MAMGPTMLAVPEVAELLGVSASRVRQFVMEGRLAPAQRLGINLLFDRRTVVAFSKKARKVGRPKQGEK